MSTGNTGKRQGWLSRWVSFEPQPQETKVGILNNGELVVIDQRGGVQLFSPATVANIRETLRQADMPRNSTSP